MSVEIPAYMRRPVSGMESISAVSGAQSSVALPRASLFEEHFRSVKGAAIGAAMGKDESWSRKFLAGEFGIQFADIPRLLDAIGLKCVPVATCSVDRELVEALSTIHERLAPMVRGALLRDE